MCAQKTPDENVVVTCAVWPADLLPGHGERSKVKREREGQEGEGVTWGQEVTSMLVVVRVKHPFFRYVRADSLYCFSQRLVNKATGECYTPCI